MTAKDLPPSYAAKQDANTVVYMDDYILERRRGIAAREQRILEAFRRYEGKEALSEYQMEAITAFTIKMGNVALQRQLHEEDRYLDEYDELEGDEL